MPLDGNGNNEPPVPIMVREVQLRLPMSDDVEGDIQTMHRIRELFDQFQGDDRVVIHVACGTKQKRLRAGVRVDWCDDVARAVVEMLGPDSYELIEREEFPAGSNRLLSA